MIQLIHTSIRGLLPKILVFSIVNLGFGQVAFAQSGGIDNPLKFDSFAAIIQEIARIATLVGLPVAVLFIVYSGFLYVTARGKETKVKKAHDVFLWSIVGTAIILGAYAISKAIEEFAKSLSS